jgi:hypothetical protein
MKRKEKVSVEYGKKLASENEHLACESPRHIRNSAWTRERPKKARAVANDFVTADADGKQR